MWRAVITFNAPVDREHVFYGAPKPDEAAVQQALEDLKPVLVHAVSVQIQYETSVGQWHTKSPLGLTDDPPPFRQERQSVFVGSKINLWVDDEREPPAGWTRAKTNEAAIIALANCEVEHLSLDYSLKGETTDEIMYWLRDHQDRWPTKSLVGHSSSRDGARLIEHMARDYAPSWAQ